jgi:hypothetical protein
MGWSAADSEVVGAVARASLRVLGIDLGKTVFHWVGLDSAGRMVFARGVSTLLQTSLPKLP